MQASIGELVIIGRGIGPTVEISVIALLFAAVFVALGQFLLRAKTPWGKLGSPTRPIGSKAVTQDVFDAF